MFKLLQSPALSFDQRGKVSVYVFPVSHLCTAFCNYRKMWKKENITIITQASINHCGGFSVFLSSLFLS